MSEPDYSGNPLSITEILTRPDFPKSALGAFVDIGGYTGIVVEIVNQSLRVRSEEGITKSFNANRLRQIYAPPQRPEPIPEPGENSDSGSSLPAVVRGPDRAEPQIEAPLEPDFGKPIKPIAAFVKRRDFPQCLLGEHIDISGFTGVVVQLVNRSIKVRTQAETTRSYNADALKKLHGG